MDRCLFCNAHLDPGSEEHVFLSALGGRVVTRRATCSQCNNALASDETGKVEDALAEAFKEVRNGLKVWSGRNGPPPTLAKAGAMPDGLGFDLAPGFIPVMRPGRLPETSQFTPGSEHTLTARDEADTKRMLSILSKRGVNPAIGRATSVQTKVPPVQFSISFDGPKVWRAVAKTAVVAFVVLYGNAQARSAVSDDLRAAIRHGTPPINGLVGWDFTNDWPTSNLQPHSKTPDARPSGFEHSVVIADVQGHSVAYVTLFGDYRFSVVLGPETQLPSRGLAINPRSSKPARFIVATEAPKSYIHKNPGSFKTEHAHICAGIQAAFQRVLQKWHEEASTARSQALAEEFKDTLQRAGDDEIKRTAAVTAFVARVATVELGATWTTDLGAIFDEDSGSVASAT